MAASPSIKLTVTNRYSFSTLEHIVWDWNVTGDCSPEPICWGVFEISPEDEVEGTVTIILTELASALSKKVDSLTPLRQSWLNISGRLKETQSWADKDHIIVQHQFPLTLQFTSIPSPQPTSLNSSPPPPLTILPETKTEIIITSNYSNFTVAICKLTGSLLQYQFQNKQLLSRPLQPNLTRAATDNDRGGAGMCLAFFSASWITDYYAAIFGTKHFAHEDHWKWTGLSADKPPTPHCDTVTVSQNNNNTATSIRVTAKGTIWTHGDDVPLFSFLTSYDVQSDGRIRLTTKLTPLVDLLNKIPSLPRVGLTTALHPSLSDVMYCGCGPHENYPDRRHSADCGVYCTSSELMHVDYVVPSENGNRCGVDWVCFSSSAGSISSSTDAGLALVRVGGGVAKKGNFSSSLWSQKELHHAKHTIDLDERHERNNTSPVFVNWDWELMGLGGDVR